MKHLATFFLFICIIAAQLSAQTTPPVDTTAPAANPETDLPPPPTGISPPSASANTDSIPPGFTTTLDSLLGIPDRFNFFIADNPAFKLLDFDPSNILRPSTPKDISIQVSEFWSGSSLVIPANFGMQVSPAMLLQSQMKKPSDWANAWQPLSLSFAASRPDSNTNFNEFVGDFSVGLQYTISDQAGERHFEKDLRRKINTQLDSLKPQLETAFIDSIRGKDSALTAQKIRTTMKSKMDAYVAKQYKAQTIAAYKAQIAPAKKAWKAENWAAQRFVIGAAASWNASDETSLIFQPDALGPGTTTSDTLLNFPGFTIFRNGVAYATLSLPLPRKNPTLRGGSSKKAPSTTTPKSTTTSKSAKPWGMWMIGVTCGGTLLDDTTSTFTGIDTLTFDSTYSIGVTTGTFVKNVGLTNRFYIGSNRVKTYVEGQLFWDSRASDRLFYLADIGLEVNILDGLWVQLYGGLTNLGRETFVNPGLDAAASPARQSIPSRPQFILNFDLRMTFPESFYGD